MSVSDLRLDKTDNFFRCVGTLSEINLKQEPCTIKIKNEQGIKVSTEQGLRIIGDMAIDTAHGVHTFHVYAQNLTSKGKPNPMWTMYTKMLDWNPQIGGDQSKEITFVSLNGRVSINDYVNRQGGISTILQWSVSKANTIHPDSDAPTGTTLNATLFIKKLHEKQ